MLTTIYRVDPPSALQEAWRRSLAITKGVLTIKLYKTQEYANTA